MSLAKKQGDSDVFAKRLVSLIDRERSVDHRQFINIGKTLKNLFSEKIGIELWRSVTIVQKKDSCDEHWHIIDDDCLVTIRDILSSYPRTQPWIAKWDQYHIEPDREDVLDLLQDLIEQASINDVDIETIMEVGFSDLLGIVLNVRKMKGSEFIPKFDMGTLIGIASQDNPDEYNRMISGDYDDMDERVSGSLFAKMIWFDFHKKWYMKPYHKCLLPELMQDLHSCVARVINGKPIWYTNDTDGINILSEEAMKTCLTSIPLRVTTISTSSNLVEKLPEVNSLKCTVNKKDGTPCGCSARYKAGAQYACGRHKANIDIVKQDSEKNTVTVYDEIHPYIISLTYRSAIYSVDTTPIANTVNLFRGFPVHYVSYTPADINVVKNHIHNIIANGRPEVANIVIQALAHNLRNPSKLGVMIIFVGGEGTGKSILINKFIDKILGHENGFECQTLEQITGRFNTEFINKRLVFINEVGSTSKHDENMLKSWITDKKQRVEGKGTNAVQIESCLNFMASTNNFDMDLIKDPTKERRFYVVNCSNKVNDRAYFTQLSNAFDTKTNEIYSWLYDQYDPSFTWDAREMQKLAPSDVMAQMSFNNRDSIATFLDECMEWIQENVPCDRDGYRDGTTIYNKYWSWCNQNNIANPVSKQWFVRKSKNRVQTDTSCKKEARWKIMG